MQCQCMGGACSPAPTACVNALCYLRLHPQKRTPEIWALISLPLLSLEGIHALAAPLQVFFLEDPNLSFPCCLPAPPHPPSTAGVLPRGPQSELPRLPGRLGRERAGVPGRKTVAGCLPSRGSTRAGQKLEKEGAVIRAGVSIVLPALALGESTETAAQWHACLVPPNPAIKFRTSNPQVRKI